jgi:hypothetical protein
MLSNRISGK